MPLFNTSSPFDVDVGMFSLFQLPLVLGYRTFGLSSVTTQQL